ncbi:MAG: S41 family peptidase, partial [Phycisphaerales bacterium]
PDISAPHIVFVYGNDLWTVAREGGRATPLASPRGQEMFPKFSPDGEEIAFVGNYEGDSDLYVIGRDGGLAGRVTHHPGTEVLNDWTADGELLFYMSGLGGLTRQTQLFTINPDGGEYDQLPVPYGAQGAISADGKWLAYTPHTRDTRTWKRYRGGMATDIWLFNLETNESRQITDWEGTDTQPMWAGDTVYYLSDNGPEHRLNLWSFNTSTGQRQQRTNFSDYDVKWPSMGPGPNGRGEIVFQCGSSLYRFDVASGSSAEVDVFIPGDRPTLRTQSRDVSNDISAWSISPSAKRVAAVARGDVWTLPAENGTPRNLTRSGADHERSVSWSPDGQWIAYFSDESGEMEMYITQSDGMGETKQLTNNSKTFYYGMGWSPDSSKIAYVDRGGNLYLLDVESGSSTLVDSDGWGNPPSPSWSSDSRWMAYSKADMSGSENYSIYLYDTEKGETHRVTSGFFNDSSPAFDRDGDFLYYASNREFSPVYDDMYSGLESPFVYVETEALIAVPLRDDVKSPYLPKSDEEEWKKDDDKAKDDKESDGGDDEKKPANGANGGGIVGEWEGTSNGMAQMGMPEDTVPFTMIITRDADGNYGATTITQGESLALENVEFNADTGEFKAEVPAPVGAVVLTATLSGSSLDGRWEVEGMGVSGTWSAKRTGDAGDNGAKADDGDEKDADDKKQKAKPVEIDIEGFESRSIQLPVKRGLFSGLAVNDKGHLLYVRRTGRGLPGAPEIMAFDFKDEKKEEKSVAKGAFAFEMTPDGKKILIPRGNGATIQNASPGGSGTAVVTSPMLQDAEPREEWESIIRNAWRVMRDYFYDPTIHGVDWEKVLEDHLAMLPDAVTREDVTFIIQEMIGEVNVGHAYYREGGDVERASNRNVGLLGADFELHDGAYRITNILKGGPWDADARGPLNHPGLDVKEGDYLLAVNGVPVDTSKDIYASFIGMAGRPITLTVSEKPQMDDDARRVIVEAVGSEAGLRYRDWVEQNRKYVYEKSEGKVGYIYVPNTGAQGQNELVRQFYGQAHMPALIIDERWNGGGQMPSRFIDILKRPASNYWAMRDGMDATSPFRAHNGPKCMLINGLAGSGGDAFPFLFRHHEVGPIIGMRTWGGLVGIGGYPPMVDGSSITAPHFAFYNTDGTWGIEGHGVDPDIEVVDDPAKMVDGGDPQLDRAIQEMLDAIEREGYQRPARPAYPDRSGMGIPESDW